MDYILVTVSILLFAAVFSSKFASRTGIPALMVFILIGILAGSDGFGGIYFDNFNFAQTLGIIALVYILFMGGLSVNIKEIKPVFTKGISLATVGVFITALITGILGYKFLNFSLLESMLLGSIISSTDAAAVFSVLRSKSISLKNNLKPLLELESGSNDPMAVFLTVGLISLIQSDVSHWYDLIFMFIKQMGIGVIFGILLGKIIVWIINKIKLEYDGLYVVITLATAAFAYSFTTLAGGNGFMAVYVSGLTMAGASFVHKKSLIQFHDGIAWIMQIVMFLMLGLLVFVKDVITFAIPAFIIAGILMFVARPISVWISMIPFKSSFNEKLLISWVGLRGAAPIVLATFPVIANIPHCHDMFNVVFFIVIISVLIQGTTIPAMARLLKLEQPLEKGCRSPLAMQSIAGTNKLIEIRVSPNSPIIKKPLFEINFPNDTLVAMLMRDDEYVIPHGATTIEGNDILSILTCETQEEALYRLIEKGETDKESQP